MFSSTRQKQLSSASLRELRDRANVARDRLSRHRVMIDRYLPTHLFMTPPGDVQDVVEYKVSELFDRSDQMDHVTFAFCSFDTSVNSSRTSNSNSINHHYHHYRLFLANCRFVGEFGLRVPETDVTPAVLSRDKVARQNGAIKLQV